MSRIAQADMLVERVRLLYRVERRSIRMDLYHELQKLGRVDDVDGYVVDPPDGPMRDPAYTGDVDLDRYAIVRIRGRVTPLTQ